MLQDNSIPLATGIFVNDTCILERNVVNLTDTMTMDTYIDINPKAAGSTISLALIQVSSNLTVIGVFPLVTNVIYLGIDPRVKINGFAANPPTIHKGESSLLSWDVSNATAIGIPYIGSFLTPLESALVNPVVTTIYELQAADSLASAKGCLARA